MSAHTPAEHLATAEDLMDRAYRQDHHTWANAFTWMAQVHINLADAIWKENA